MAIPEFLIDPQKDYYAVLGVAPTTPHEDIRRAFKRLAIKHHPDKGGSTEKMAEINEANEVVGNEEHREMYDRLRREYNDPNEWNFTEEDYNRRQRPSFFDNLKNCRLRDFIYDSLIMFQEQFHIIIPEDVIYDFRSAVQFVYENWDDLKREERVSYTTFGGFRVRTRDEIVRSDNLFG